MAPIDPARQRRVALFAGVLAAVTLGGVLLIWLTSAAAAARAPFGSGGSPAVVAAGLAVVVAGIVVVYLAPRLPTPLAWTGALVIAVVNGAVGCLALVTVLSPEDNADIGIALLLGIAIFGTNIVAGQVARRRAEPTG